MNLNLLLPPPISQNDMFSNVSAKQRTNAAVRGQSIPGRVKTERYKAWRATADGLLTAQRRPRQDDPVTVTIYCGEIDAKAKDADNCSKAVLDTLVDARILVDDSKKWVRGVSEIWVQGLRGTVVVIEPSEVEIDAAEVLSWVNPKLVEAFG